MTERPILFSGPMVRALLAERKTQTRRVVKNPDYFGCITGDCPHDRAASCAEQMANLSPYGKAGDRLWVRETWRDDRLPHDDPDREGTHIGYLHRADPEEKDSKRYPWRPSIFMPRAACRLVLDVTDVRVERLQDISEEDAQREGISAPTNGSYRGGFALLWDSLNGKRGMVTWTDNPWVWVVEFKRGTA